MGQCIDTSMARSTQATEGDEVSDYVDGQHVRRVCLSGAPDGTWQVWTTGGGLGSDDFKATSVEVAAAEVVRRVRAAGGTAVVKILEP